MQTRTLVTFWLGVCSLVLLTVTGVFAQDSNMVQPAAGPTSTVNHRARHDIDQTQSHTSAADSDRDTFHPPKGDEMKFTLPGATAREHDRLVVQPVTTRCSSKQWPWCWPSMSRASSAAYTEFGPDAVRRCNWCRARR